MTLCKRSGSALPHIAMDSALYPFTHTMREQHASCLYEFGNQTLSSEIALVTFNFRAVTNMVPEPKESL